MGSVVARRNCTPIIIADADVINLLGEQLTSGFKKAPPIIAFAGQISLVAIGELVKRVEACRSDDRQLMIYGVGGGKTLDAAKGVALRLSTEFVSVPTIASNDSPVGRAIAIYEENGHRLSHIEHIASNPEAVIVDTAVLALAPARFLRAGIGDAIAKKFEAERAHRDGAKNFFDTPPLQSPLVLADACYKTLRRCGVKAMMAAENHQVTADFEAVVEASLLMAGIAWESGGISLAHGVVRGIARCAGSDKSLHGEHVAYGLLVMLALEQNNDDEIIDLMTFYRQIGQATSLGGLGLEDIDNATITRIAQWTFDGPSNGNLIVSTTQPALEAGLRKVEKLHSETLPESLSL